MTRDLLMVPGPSIVDPETLLELAKPIMSHVSAEFDSVHKETINILKKVFGTEGPVIIIPGSGTAALELALRATISTNSKVLVLKAGFFGEYLAEASRRLGAKVEVFSSQTGEGFNYSNVKEILEKRDFDVVALEHVETSVSVANDIAGVSKAAKEFGAKVVVDGVASIGGMEMKMEEWGVDVCFTGSQKALAVPPGLGIVAIKKDAQIMYDKRSLYFDIEKLIREMDSTKNYHITPAVNMVYALNKAMKIIEKEGLERRYERHRILADAVRGAMEAMNLSLVAKKGYQANTVTAVYLPNDVSWPKFYGEMHKRGVEIAGGLGELAGKIFRIGHMGEVNANDIIATVGAIERALKSLGYSINFGTGVSVAQEILFKNGF